MPRYKQQILTVMSAYLYFPYYKKHTSHGGQNQ